MRKSNLANKVTPMTVGADVHFVVSHSKDHSIKYLDVTWVRRRLLSEGKPNDDELRGDIEAIGSFALAQAGYFSPHRIDVVTYKRVRSGTRHTMTVHATLTLELQTDN